MGHKFTNVRLILKIWEIILWLLGKLVMGHSSGYFERASTSFDPEIVPRCALDNLGVKKA
jgi:hypothetical protein